MRDLIHMIALLCLDCAFLGFGMNPCRDTKTALAEVTYGTAVEKKNMFPGLSSNIPFILMVLSNFYNAFILYFVYTSIPYV